MSIAYLLFMYCQPAKCLIIKCVFKKKKINLNPLWKVIKLKVTIFNLVEGDTDFFFLYTKLIFDQFNFLNENKQKIFDKGFLKKEKKVSRMDRGILA